MPSVLKTLAVGSAEPAVEIRQLDCHCLTGHRGSAGAAEHLPARAHDCICKKKDYLEDLDKGFSKYVL